MTHELHGRCHCGNLTVTYTTSIAPADAAVRSCTCSFCRKHGARAVSDPAGAIAYTARDPDQLRRYRFETGATDFLICHNCGVYVGAYMEDGDAGFANVMVNVLDDREKYGQDPAPTDYGGEDEAGKRQRRRDNWTPATLRLGG